MAEEQKITDEELKSKSTDDLIELWNKQEEDADLRKRIDVIFNARELIEEQKCIKEQIKNWKLPLSRALSIADNFKDVVDGLIEADRLNQCFNEYQRQSQLGFAISLVRLRDLLKGSPKEARELLSFLVLCKAVTPMGGKGLKGKYSRAKWFREVLNEYKLEGYISQDSPKLRQMRRNIKAMEQRIREEGL